MEILDLKLEFDKDDYKVNEAYKSLRTNIEFSGDNKVLVFTSCQPNEGKSTVSIKLALSLAEAGKKVAFIDADLRKSVLVGRYRIKGENKGLTHFLVGLQNVDEVLYKTTKKNLHVMLAGAMPPNPSELLGTARFGGLIETLREFYDYVIIDAPPIGAVIDAAIIARQADAAVLVIAAGQDSYKFAQAAKDQMEKADCKILGAILNKVDTSSNGYYGKYYGKYYGRYYGSYGND